MLTDRRGQLLPVWLDAVRQDDLRSFRTPAAGIDRDIDAVTAGLTLPWSYGAVEGHVNRIKMLKGQTYGLQLLAVVNGWPAPKSLAPVLHWSVRALRVRTQQ
ncbi:transposase [Streptomyces sp. NEAU-sy36]|nr:MULTISPECIES: transposase [unclassified Streptomyces]QLJ02759.1 transposase [Streptomyces sp. NEAU-sy36]